jgi:hypothetical protein
MAQRYDTATSWTAVNPTLLAGEIGVESDTKKWKVGTGSTAWNSLAYAIGGSYPIVNADIASNAEIAVSKLADGTPRQLLQTDAAGTGVEWASNIDIPGTLDVTGAATFDNNVIIQGDLLVGNQSDVRFGEATANGSNWVAFQGAASIAANVTWTLPATDATVAGHALKSNAAGTLSWGTAGGATGGGTDDVFYENSQTVTTSYTLTASKNAMSAGPITINSGVTVTVPSGASWVVV